MQNVTRTLSQFEIKAYDLGEDELGNPVAVCVAECLAEGTSMTKGEARALLGEAKGEKLAKGLTIKWEPIATRTYAMPLDQFVANAKILDESIMPDKIA